MSTTLQTIGVDTCAGSGASAGIWAEVVSHTDSKYGGLSSAVPALSASLACSSNVSTRMEAFCIPGEKTLPEGISAHDINFWPAGRQAWMSTDLRARFKEALCGVAGVHIHGLWESSTAVAVSACRSLDIPYILSAHGMLEPWALRSSRLKKQLYSLLIERRNVGGAACLHALTRSEADQFRAFGARGPIAIIPNGVAIPSERNTELFFRRFPHLLGKRVILFLARLHPKKGLDLLLQSWPAIAASWPEAHLVLAGPDCEGTQAGLERLIAAQQLQTSVTFTGMLRGAEKWSALNAAECFILPSYSEGLSVSVLEALGVGCPVIVTEACNMPEVSENKAGWQVASSSAAISGALHEVLQNTIEQNGAIGLRGAELVQRRYTWPVVGDLEQMHVFAIINAEADSQAGNGLRLLTMLLYETLYRVPDIRLPKKRDIFAQSETTCLDHAPHIGGPSLVHFDCEIREQEAVGAVGDETHSVLQFKAGAAEIWNVPQGRSEIFELVRRNKRVANLHSLSVRSLPCGIDHLADQVFNTLAKVPVLIEIWRGKVG